MRFDFGRSGRVTADIAFYGLALLAFGLLVALSGFLSYTAPVYEACKSVWDNLLLWISSLGVLLPAAVIGSVVAVTGFTLIRQWRATQRLLSALALYRVPVPPRLARIAREVGLEDRIDCVSGIVVAPFCYGFVQPRVCVPTVLLDILDDAELRAVLCHEGYHARNRDPLKIWLSRALARGVYFLPLAGDLRDSYLAAKEIAADETMVQTDELPLASALVKMLSAEEFRLESAIRVLAPSVERKTSSAEVTAAALGNLSIAGLISVTRVSPNETEERVRRLIDGRPAQLALPSVTSVVLSAVIVIAIFVVSYTNLNAASMMPVSQECVKQNVLRRRSNDFNRWPQSALTIEWPVTSLADDETSGAPMVIDQRDMPAVGQFDCDLLIAPDCTEVDLSGSQPAADKGTSRQGDKETKRK